MPIIGAANFGYYFGTGKLASSIDQNGADSYSHFLDPLDRPTHSFSPTTNGNRGWTLTTYSVGATQTDTYAAITDVAPSTGCSSCQHSQAVVDAFGRNSQSILANDPDGPTITAITYDSSGRTHTLSNPYRTTSDPTYGLSTYSFDSLGRPTLITEPDGSTLSSYYGNDVTSHGGISSQLCSQTTYGSGYPLLNVDEAGNKRQTWADALGRTIEVDEPDPISGNLTIATCYAFDVLDNLTSVVQRGGTTDSTQWRTRTFVYDELSRLKTATEPESGTTSYSYDNNNNLVSKTDSRNIVTTYSYDALNRLTQKTYSDGTPTATYTYDLPSVDGFTLANSKGRLVKAGTSGTYPSAIYYYYDAVGRVLNRGECVYINGCGGSSPTLWVTTNSYDLMGNVTSYTDSNGVTLTQSFDNAARATKVTSTWSDATHPTTLVSIDPSIGYYPDGSIRKAALGNGLTQTAALNNRLQTCRINLNSSGTSLSQCSDSVTAGNLLDLTLGYGTSGANNASVKSWSSSGQQIFNRTYSYDRLNRISGMSAPGDACPGLTWNIDNWGNRTGQTPTVSGTCPSNLFNQPVNTKNQFTSGSYDAAGNLLGDGFHTYSFDAENRIKYVDTGNTGLYIYDAEGHRVAKAANSLTTYYVYGIDGQVAAERDANGNWTQTYLYLGGAPFALYRGSNTGFLHQDHLGSTRLVTLSDKSVYDNLDYLPFGEQVTGGNGTSHKFTFNERDNETSLDYASARHYNANLGRFLAPDPLSGYPTNPQSWNRYAYVNNNPLNSIDPSGMCSEDDGWSDCPDVPTFAGVFGFGFDPTTGAPYDFGGIFDPFNMGGVFGPPPPLPVGSEGAVFTGVWQGAYNQLLDFATVVNNSSAYPGASAYSSYLQSQKYSVTSQRQLAGMSMSMALPFLIPGGAEEEAAIEGIEAAESAGNVGRLLESVEQHGRTITFATPGSEELRYLDYMGAEANVGGPGRLNILLRENPSKEAILEEFLHGTQDRLGIIDRLGENGAEVHVKSFMARHRRLLGLP